MPYYIYVVTTNETSQKKSATLASEFENFRAAKNEIKRLRADKPLDTNQIYKINFSASQAEAEEALTTYREDTIAREWEK